jgi:septal ring factor EnvC (AmiA/AmiB activator)
LEEVQNPDFLINLKKEIREVDKDIKDHEKSLQVLHVEQARREKRLDRIIEKNEPETIKSINDSNARLAYMTEKITEL